MSLMDKQVVNNKLLKDWLTVYVVETWGTFLAGDLFSMQKPAYGIIFQEKQFMRKSAGK